MCVNQRPLKLNRAGRTNYKSIIIYIVMHCSVNCVKLVCACCNLTAADIALWYFYYYERMSLIISYLITDARRIEIINWESAFSTMRHTYILITNAHAPLIPYKKYHCLSSIIDSRTVRLITLYIIIIYCYCDTFIYYYNILYALCSNVVSYRNKMRSGRSACFERISQSCRIFVPGRLHPPSRGLARLIEFPNVCLSSKPNEKKNKKHLCQ